MAYCQDRLRNCFPKRGCMRLWEGNVANISPRRCRFGFHLDYFRYEDDRIRMEPWNGCALVWVISQQNGFSQTKIVDAADA